MRAFRYQENIAEQWLHAARDKVIDGVERLTEQQEVGRWEYIGMVLAVKVRCVGAIFVAVFAGLGALFRASGLTISNLLLHKASDMQVEEAWADAQEAVDLILSGFSALFDSDSVLSTADRGNVRRIYALGRKLQDVQSHPKLHPLTKKELETWYRNAKVFVRKGGDEAKTEMVILAQALDQIEQTPDAAPEKLMSYRWDANATGSVEVEKIRGIRWKAVEEAAPETEDLSKRKWKKKSS